MLEKLNPVPSQNRDVRVIGEQLGDGGCSLRVAFDRNDAGGHIDGTCDSTVSDFSGRGHSVCGHNSRRSHVRS